MTLRPETATFARDLESHSHRPLNFPQEVGLLVELAGNHGMAGVFEDAIFHAKFVTRSQEVMQRIGKNGDGFDKLMAEYQSSLEKTTTLLKTLVKESPDDVKQGFVSNFFSLDQESFGRLNKLLTDLSLVKNWQVDGKPLPWAPSLEQNRSEDPKPGSAADSEMKKVLSTVRLLILLFIGFLLVDPPVSIVGWAISFVILSLLIYNVLTISAVRRNTRGNS